MQVIIEQSFAEVNVSCALYQDLWNYTTNACGFFVLMIYKTLL
jgi:hypothetical protein